MQLNSNVFSLKYLGRTNLPSHATGLGAVQEPLLSLYTAYSTNTGLKSISDIRLSLYEEGIRIKTEKMEETYPMASIFLCKSIALVCANDRAKNGFGYAFQIADLQDPSGILLTLPKKLSYLLARRHPPLLVCVMRRSGGAQPPQVHAFICSTPAEAAAIANSVSKIQSMVQMKETPRNLFDYTPFPSISPQQSAQPRTGQQRQPTNGEAGRSLSVKKSAQEMAAAADQMRRNNDQIQLNNTGMSSLDLARQIAQCPERVIEDAKNRKSVMLKKSERSDRSSSFMVASSKERSASQRQPSGSYMLSQNDFGNYNKNNNSNNNKNNNNAYWDGSEQTHSLKHFHFTDLGDQPQNSRKDADNQNIQKDPDLMAIYENSRILRPAADSGKNPQKPKGGEEFKGPQRQLSANEAELRPQNIYQNDHMNAPKRATVYSPNIDFSAELNKKPTASVQPNVMFGVRVLPKDLNIQKLKATPPKVEPKKDDVIYSKVNHDKTPLQPSPVVNSADSPVREIKNDMMLAGNKSVQSNATPKSKSADSQRSKTQPATAPVEPLKYCEFDTPSKSDAVKVNESKQSRPPDNIIASDARKVSGYDSTLPACGEHFEKSLGYLP